MWGVYFCLQVTRTRHVGMGVQIRAAECLHLARRTAINASHASVLAPHVCISVSLYGCKCHMASTVTVSLVPTGKWGEPGVFSHVR